ncbi:MAG: perosamine synthetase [Blastopirellula sp.]|nr:MAG: perosamine synthetase [Blastopirellula sp.]
MPAALGGSPVFPTGPPAWPMEEPAVREALLQSYQDGSWGKYHGQQVDQLESKLAEYHGVSSAATCASGTIAVEIALRALNLPEQCEVILAAYDFAGNFRAIQAIGARPVLVDIDPTTWCIDLNQLEQAINSSTKAVIVSHLHGGLANMPGIMQLAAKHGLKVVEDACQVPGAMLDGKKAGTTGDVGVFSFGGSKLLTAGRGGAVITDAADVAQRIKVVCERGNHAYPLSELQAAVLNPQLETLDERNKQRNLSVDLLRTQLDEVCELKPIAKANDSSSTTFYKFAWLLDSECGIDRAKLCDWLRAEGVAIDPGFRGFAKRPDKWCRKVGDLRYSRAAAEKTVLLHHPVLLQDEETIGKVAIAIKRVISHLMKK